MKNLLITGASRGIGAAIARAAAAEGYNIIINYKSSVDAAKSIEAELGRITGTLAVQADVANPNDRQNLIRQAQDRFGHITHLVNNAGVCWTGLLTDSDDCQNDSIIDTNLGGVIGLTKLVAKDMLERHFGSIVNISSIWGKSGASCEAVYSATKAGIIGFTQAMAKELGPSDIRVNAVCPGVIDTDM